MRKFSQGKPVFITGNPVLIAGIPVMKTGFPLWEFPHKENPLLITGIGLQCSRPRYLATSSLKKFFFMYYKCVPIVLPEYFSTKNYLSFSLYESNILL